MGPAMSTQRSQDPGKCTCSVCSLEARYEVHYLKEVVGNASHDLSAEKMCRKELMTGLRLLTLERPTFKVDLGWHLGT